MLTKDNFFLITKNIIDNLEGGYYHPDFYNTGAKKSNGGYVAASAFKALYSSSGETLYGLDRTAGHDISYSTAMPSNISTPLYSSKTAKATRYAAVVADMANIYSNKYKYKTPAAAEFWSTIDKLNARKKWTHEYLPTGATKTRLQNLASQIMFNEYQILKAAAIKKGIATQAVFNNAETDTYLAHNLVYSVWNGIGTFNTFCKLIQSQINKGVTDSTTINKSILAYRKNTGITQYVRSASILDNFYKIIPDFLKKKNDA